jgi:phenylalanyl-tRNA synthetase alpha chain
MMNNVPKSIEEKIGKNLHQKKNHPVEIIKRMIYDYFGEDFIKKEDFSPMVSVEQNFDDLRIPKDHPSRSASDTYYIDTSTVLRTQTSSHQTQMLKDGYRQFLVTGDVYRKDTIDASHYPVFHQMEGVKLCENPEEDLKKTLVGLVNHLFPGCEYRINEDYFPFTEPSFEIEVKFEGEWLEILGCGVIHTEILDNCNIKETGWAFGLGLDRLAMILFKIPDIRYLWSDDIRFISQFESGEIVEFEPYSKYPPVFKDVAYWLGEKYHYNDFSSIVREEGGDLIEKIELLDEFTHPKTGKTSNCHRIVYRSHDEVLTNENINKIQERIRNRMTSELEVELR